MHNGRSSSHSAAPGPSRSTPPSTTRRVRPGSTAIPVTTHTTGIFAGAAFRAAHASSRKSVALPVDIHYSFTTGHCRPSVLVLDPRARLQQTNALPPSPPDVNDLIPVGGATSRHMHNRLPENRPGRSTALRRRGRHRQQHQLGGLSIQRVPHGGAKNTTRCRRSRVPRAAPSPGNIRGGRVTLGDALRAPTQTRLETGAGDSRSPRRTATTLTAITTHPRISRRRYPATFSVRHPQHEPAANPYLLFWKGPLGSDEFAPAPRVRPGDARSSL